MDSEQYPVLAVPEQEIELKFAVGPADLNRLRRLPLFADSAPFERYITSTYYDTPHLDLKQQSLALRIRKEGKSYVQTLKAGAARAPGFYRRSEWEGPVDRPAPDLSPPAVKDRLGDLAYSELQPVFSSRVRRSTRVLRPMADTLVEVAFDRGRLATPAGAELPICEVELELKGGDPRALFDIARRLNEVAALRLETRSKSARGYDLIAGHPESDLVNISRYGRLELARDMPVEEALAAMVRRSIEHLLENEAATRSGAVEGVHQMRVALRRLRVAFNLFKPFVPEDQRLWAIAEVKWLMHALGEARNCDIVSGLLAPVMAAFKSDADLKALDAAVGAHRREAYDRLAGVLGSKRYTAFAIDLIAWLETRAWRRQQVSESSVRLLSPLGDLADQLLAGRYRKIRKLAKQFDELGADGRHKLRIAIKKMRYAADSFERIYDSKMVGRFLKRLSVLQDELGLLNDVATADRLISGLRGDAEEGRHFARGAALVQGWWAHVAADRTPKLHRKLTRLFKAAQFW